MTSQKTLAIGLMLGFGLLTAACGDDPKSTTMAPIPDAGTPDAPDPQPDANPEPVDDATPDGGEDEQPDPEPGMDPDPNPEPDPEPGPEPGMDPEPCAFGTPGEANRDRVVLISHPFGAMAPEIGTDIHGLTITTEGELLDDGARLDVGFRVSRIEFVPSGELALVLGEDGELASVSVGGSGDLAVIDRVALPSADFSDMVVTDGGQTVFAVGTNVAETSGLSTIQVACDGTLTAIDAGFFNLRLAQSLALLPGKSRAVLAGGQAVFEPLDDDDLRLLERVDSGWRQIQAFDIYTDFVTTGRMGRSPDGGLVLVPNSSPFSEEGGQIAVVAVEQDTLREVQRLTGLPDAEEVRFSTDGTTAIVTLFEPGQVAVLAIDGLDVVETARIRGVGLPEQIATIDRGDLTGTILLPSTDAQTGPNIAILRFSGPGAVDDLGQLQLGDSGPNIPGAIAISP